MQISGHGRPAHVEVDVRRTHLLFITSQVASISVKQMSFNGGGQGGTRSLYSHTCIDRWELPLRPCMKESREPFVSLPLVCCKDDNVRFFPDQVDRFQILIWPAHLTLRGGTGLGFFLVANQTNRMRMGVTKEGSRATVYSNERCQNQEALVDE